jgi:hypothetical protein
MHRECQAEAYHEAAAEPDQGLGLGVRVRVRVTVRVWVRVRVRPLYPCSISTFARLELFINHLTSITLATALLTDV